MRLFWPFFPREGFRGEASGEPSGLRRCLFARNSDDGREWHTMFVVGLLTAWLQFRLDRKSVV